MGSEFSQRIDATEVLSTAILHKVPQDFKRSLVEPIVEEEIWIALKSIHRDKAPGPDGFNSAFSLTIGLQ